MRALTTSDLLRTSEVLQGQNPLEQALTILHAALPELDREALEKLTVSDRDARLLELREKTLGPELEGQAECPRCGAHLEFVVRTTELVQLGASRSGQNNLEKGDLRLQLRMPTSRDLFAVSDLSPEEGPRALALRCIVNIDGEKPRSLEALPDDVIEEAAKKLCDNEPTAESLLNLKCPACEHRWEMALDIGSFLAKEIDVLARRLMLEVHVLATAYGWTEREALMLSARRRQAYLELVSYA